MYDTEAGSYVSLEDLKRLIRDGEQVKVVDNTNGEDITAQTLTQIVLEEGKKGQNPFSSDLLHNVIRWGNDVIDESIETVKHRIDNLVPGSIQKMLGNSGKKTEEIDELKSRIEQLEETISTMQSSVVNGAETKESNNTTQQ